jgi:polysaccharide deacetylase 2 family uncharacterized protein YibQ
LNRRLCALIAVATAALAQPVAAGPLVAVIIDDLGNRPSDARLMAALPGPVACAVLPGTPYAQEVARACHAAGKVVMLHLPMQSIDPAADPGPGGLLLRDSRADVERRLDEALEQVPHASGVNNHMGSVLTTRVAYMHWLMRALADRRLWFVDSYTSGASLAVASARLAGVPALRRDVFLDNERDASAIGAQWERLLETASRQGAALAIGHPHPETFAALQARLPALAGEGFSLVSPPDMIATTQPGESAWPAFSSP